MITRGEFIPKRNLQQYIDSMIERGLEKGVIETIAETEKPKLYGIAIHGENFFPTNAGGFKAFGVPRFFRAAIEAASEAFNYERDQTFEALNALLEDRVRARTPSEITAIENEASAVFMNYFAILRKEMSLLGAVLDWKPLFEGEASADE